MSIDDRQAVEPTGRTVDYAQYIVVAVLVLVGGFLVYSSLTLDEGFAKVDPVGPRLFPMIIGIGLLVMAAILAIAIPRGSRAVSYTHLTLPTNREV